MNEQDRDSQLSALFDGQLPADETVLATRRLLKDGAQQQRWSRYALIGASLRGEPLLQRPAGEDLAARIQRRLADEAALAEPVAQAAPVVSTARTGTTRWAWGGALAASVALAAILVARWQMPAQTTLVAGTTPAAVVPAAPLVADPAAPALPPADVAAQGPAKAYTTPGDPVSPQVRFGTPLVGYVAVHSDYAAPVGLRGPVSALMYGRLDPTEDTVEMTEAEVGARR
jgi:negative regulator of sigma E activity